jgi:hypothetical protein
VLGFATFGVALLIGGVTFSISGSALSKKADEAWEQANEEKICVDSICEYLVDLSAASKKFYHALSKVNKLYKINLKQLEQTVNIESKTDFSTFTAEEKLNFDNTAILVRLLNVMCKVNVVIPAENEEGLNKVNHALIDSSLGEMELVMKSISQPHSADDSYDEELERMMADYDEKLKEYS